MSGGNWRIEKGIVIFSDKFGKEHFPSSADFIFQKSTGKYIFEDEIYKSISEELGLSISSLCVNFKTEFLFDKSKIKLQITAERKNETSKVSYKDGYFLDYAIFQNKIYSLSSEIKIINEILKNQKITDAENVDTAQYIKLLQELNVANISFTDSVQDNIRTNGNISTLKNLNATLYPYQKNGFGWLRFMVSSGIGAILADEMGLGKTLQIIALFDFLKNKNEESHFLVVAPVSLLLNWQREIEKFCSSLKTLIHHGSERSGNYNDLLPFDIVITSYSNICSDLSMFNMIGWNLVVLDEAQNIKNPNSQRTKCVKMLKRKIGIAVTGTPFENHMTDIWSIVDFAIPSFLGTLKEFENEYDDSSGAAERLEKFISPIILRRRVKDVAQDLPRRVDIPQAIEMTVEEAKLYESQRKEIDSANDLRPASLGEIQKLRMFCTHPAVYEKKYSSFDPFNLSNKYQRLCEILDEIIFKNEKSIIFTSFNEMIKIMLFDLRSRFQVKTFFINGSIASDERQKIVDEFSAFEGSAILILNPHACGTGLNITAANHVIHYNLEWNPALEDQASARAYRRGQTKTVFIHRLFYSGTIEEIINERIERKRQLSNTAVVGTDGTEDAADLIRALSISPVEKILNQ